MNTKVSKVIGLLAMVAIVLSACNIITGALGTVQGSGNLVAESRQVRNFDRLSLNGSGEVIITQSGEESLTVETDDNIMPYITTDVRDGTLYLGSDTRRIKGISPTHLRFTLKVKDLVGLDILGSGDITAPSLATDRLAVCVCGSGAARIGSLAAEEVEVEINGSGNVELVGEATRQAITINGTGEVHSGDLLVEAAEVAISGSGDVTIWATESLDAHISGSGSVNCYGNPQTSLSGSGSGKINSLGKK